MSRGTRSGSQIGSLLTSKDLPRTMRLLDEELLSRAQRSWGPWGPWVANCLPKTCRKRPSDLFSPNLQVLHLLQVRELRGFAVSFYLLAFSGLTTLGDSLEHPAFQGSKETMEVVTAGALDDSILDPSRLS